MPNMKSLQSQTDKSDGCQLTKKDKLAAQSKFEVLPIGFQTSSSAIAKRPRVVSCLSVVSFVASILQYFNRSFFIISYFGFRFRTIRFYSVVFGVTSSFAVIHTIRGRP